MNTPNWKLTLCVSGSILCGLAIKAIKNKVAKYSGQCEVNEVLFYGAEGEKQKEEIGLNNLYCIKYVIAHANRTIDVCVPSLDSYTISKCLRDVHEKHNVTIRIAVHNSDDFIYTSSYFNNTGIQVKEIKSAEKLEHEFILIDASEDASDAIAVIGSLDYEVYRVNCNRDTTMLVSEAAVLKTLRREFDRVWNSVYDVVPQIKGKESSV